MLPEPDGALRVTGLALPRISDVAHDADVRLWELSPHQASLEEAYMRMTQGAVDYRSTADEKAGLMPPVAPGYAAAGDPRGAAARAGTRRRRPARTRTRPRPAAAPPLPRLRRRRAGPGRSRRPDQARGRPMTTPYQQPQPHPAGAGRGPLGSYTSPIAVRRATFGDALASEWTKIRSVRSTMWTLGVLVVLDRRPRAARRLRRARPTTRTWETARSSCSASTECCSADLRDHARRADHRVRVRHRHDPYDPDGLPEPRADPRRQVGGLLPARVRHRDDHDGPGRGGAERRW